MGTEDKAVSLWIDCRPSLNLVAQMVKNPGTRKTRVRSLGWEDPLEKGTATPTSILAWKIPRTEEPGGVQSMGVTKSPND